MSAASLEARNATPRTEGLHDRYGAAVLAYCARRLRSREEAEDATQIVFLNAYRRLAEGVVPQSEPAWLFTIARNVVLHRRRMLARRARIEFPADLAGLQAAAPAVSETAPELFGLADALAGLTEPQRRAIVLREWAGLSYREIAAELDLSISAVETLIFRARRSLAERVEPRGRERKGALGLCLPGGVKSLLGGAAVKVATGAASVAVIVAAGAPLVSDRGPAARLVPLGRVAAPGARSSGESRRPSAVGLPPARHRAVVPRRPKSAPAAAATASVGWTVPTVESDPPVAAPKPAAPPSTPPETVTPPEAVTPVNDDPAPAPIPDVPTPAAAPPVSGTPASTSPTPGPPAQPGPPPVAAAPEGAGPPSAPPPTAATPGVPTLPDAAADRTLQEHVQAHGSPPATLSP
jgi:RNA polymerase sigma factor (sigma-70 family)